MADEDDVDTKVLVGNITKCQHVGWLALVTALGCINSLPYISGSSETHLFPSMKPFQNLCGVVNQSTLVNIPQMVPLYSYVETSLASVSLKNGIMEHLQVVSFHENHEHVPECMHCVNHVLNYFCMTHQYFLLSNGTLNFFMFTEFLKVSAPSVNVFQTFSSVLHQPCRLSFIIKIMNMFLNVCTVPTVPWTIFAWITGVFLLSYGTLNYRNSGL